MSYRKWLYSFTGMLPPIEDIDPHSEYLLHLYNTPSYSYYLLDALLKHINVIALMHSGIISSKIDFRDHRHMLIIYEEHLNLLKNLCHKHTITELHFKQHDKDHQPSIERVFKNANFLHIDSNFSVRQFQFHLSETHLVCSTHHFFEEVVDYATLQFKQTLYGIRQQHSADLIDIHNRIIYRIIFPS